MLKQRGLEQKMRIIANHGIVLGIGSRNTTDLVRCRGRTDLTVWGKCSVANTSSLVVPRQGGRNARPAERMIQKAWKL